MGCPDVIGSLTGDKFREVISGQNRVVSEVKDDTLYVHLIVDTWRGLIALLQNIVMQTVSSAVC
jgi:toxin ParE1/3/4